jgi:hypothetical protein
MAAAVFTPDTAVALVLRTVLASNTPFVVLFSIFVVAMLVLIFITLRWTIRRDRAGREAWRQRQEDRAPPNPGP